jgi:hypothetical protein
MRLHKVLVAGFLATAVWVAGCAAPGGTPEELGMEDDDAETRVVCTRSTPTGSRLPETTCRTVRVAKDEDALREQMLDDLRWQLDRSGVTGPDP